jgi:cell division protein FtsB
MTITTEQAELLARMADLNGPTRRGAALRSLAAERDALRAEVERLKAGGCARGQSTTQFCAEAVALQAENVRLREAIEMARECIDDKDVIGARQTLTMALGETQ